MRRSAAIALAKIVAGLYEAADTPEHLSAAEKIALAVQQALRDTPFKATQKKVNQTLQAIQAEH